MYNHDRVIKYVSHKGLYSEYIKSSITAFSAHFFITSPETFAPKAISIAFIKILLPAPVSPVMTFNPSEKSTVKSSMSMYF